VSFTATASDLVDGNLTVTCTPASGDTLAIGTTTVARGAQDASGNSSAGSFTVTVRGASQQMTDLVATVTKMPLDPPTRNNFRSISQNAQTAIANGDTARACDKLTSFISQVQALSGKKISAATAASLITDAERVKSVLGCP
jgi:HYR domain-containing protein